MTSPAPIAMLNRPPERFDDRIHESVESRDAEDGAIVRLTIIGGKDGETVSLQLGAPALCATTELTAEASIRIGQLLIAAGRESLGLEGGGA